VGNVFQIKFNIYLPKFNASDSDYLKYGFGRGKLDDIKYNWVWMDMVKR
jgi:hypothetical protein